MRRAVVLLAVAVLAVGCGDKSKVGAEFEGEKGSGAGGGLRDFVPKETPRTLETTPTPTAAATPAPTAAPQATVTPRPAVEFAITPGGFDKNVVTVFQGSTIKLTNKDPEKPRGIMESNGEFESPLLKTGESWTYVVDLPPGTYTIQETERIYNTASLQVVARQ